MGEPVDLGPGMACPIRSRDARIAKLEAEVARLQHNGDEWREMSLDNARAADASAKRIISLEAALTRIAEHPESYRDGRTSYAAGWAFWNVQNIAKAALATAAGVPVRGEEG